jgi:hypothetical protein
MTSAVLQIDLLTYWHAGTGLRAGGGLDALVLRDADGLPRVPGRTVKGLLRECVQLASTWPAASSVPRKACDVIFGEIEDKPYGPDTFFAGDASLSREVRAWLLAQPSFKAGLFDSCASTALDKHGLAEEKTLRVIELTLPVRLEAPITWDEEALDPRLDPQSVSAVLQSCVPLLRSLGSHRHRGLGRCTAKLLVAP